ncbi:hypothetical protein [Frondihabitans cladoniiphilus]|uniref:Uncharacterized protein n=1 Tax=Frondihabitans cladoniiphilus TaxID=715785 RepID=A0ABP8W2X3_9MICO
MTPDEARASLIDLYVATRDSLGGTWTIGSQTWLGCRLSDGTEGAAFALGAQRRGQALDADPKEMAHRVKVQWSALGISSSLFFHDEIAQYELSFPRFGLGPAPDGFIVQLSISDGYVGFSGESRCVPGDSYELDVGEIGRTDE